MYRSDSFSEIFHGAVLSIPFYFIWNKLAPIYLPQLPKLFLEIPFWNCMGVFVLIAIARAMLLPSRMAMVKAHPWEWMRK